MMLNEARPSWEHAGKTYYNRTHAAKYVGMTDSGLRRKIEKLEADHGIAIPIISRGGLHRLIDKRILDQFLVPIFPGQEERWYNDLKAIVDRINRGE